MAILCNTAQGFKRLLDLGLYQIFKDKLGLQPAEIEILVSIINFPWVAKIMFAIVIDNWTFFGSRRKSYLFFACIVNIVSLMLLIGFSSAYGKVFITSCVMMNQICMTICDSISDALVV